MVTDQRKYMREYYLKNKKKMKEQMRFYQKNKKEVIIPVTRTGGEIQIPLQTLFEAIKKEENIKIEGLPGINIRERLKDHKCWRII
ncbi:MAG: hypothetical protein DDT40_00839 [candidate division WS2 bacterium]|nr:hypothetical protein [Candidatus Psychracetigena formicireducens]